MHNRRSLGKAVFLSCLGLFLLMGSYVSARPHKGMHHGWFGMGFSVGMVEKLAAEIGLKGEALDKVKELAYQAEKQGVRLKAKIKESYIDLKKLMHDKNPNKQKIMEHVEKTGRLEIQLRKNHVELLLSIRELLTPEQREKMIQLRKEHRKSRRHSREKNHHPHRY